MSERFYCREESIIDKERNIRLVKIYYHGELLEEYFSSNTQEKDSSYAHYYNGNKSYIQQLRNGKMNGLSIVFYPNGDTNYVQYYINDTLQGYSYGFYRNQKLKYRCLYKNGECVERNNYDSIK
jgi:antitoxin component YwqK of YwqJK toxin-antitoxin module